MSAPSPAWHHPATRRAWLLNVAPHLLRVPLGLAVSVVAVFVLLPTPVWLI
ncbi:hypothetical protein [Streptomyces sp. NPDC042319]|uniref:hypothetical protein n=1 Tax=Streptomyces sp. NPDC042319 TaxID=3154332 RepID=UPI0033ECE229